MLIILNYLSRYTLFALCGSCRATKGGGGVMILVSKVLVSRQLTSDIFDNKAFNICAVSIGSGTNHTVIVCVNRPHWAKLSDTKDLCQALDNIVIKHERVIIVGDFNPTTMALSR